MTKKKDFINDPSIIAVFQKMIKAVPGVEMKGATCPYLSLNGNMYSSISKADVIGLRLSKDDREAFIEKYQATLYEAFPGFFQKEYVAVPASMHKDTRALRSWFRKSYDNVSSLKSKPTAKQKKK